MCFPAVAPRYIQAQTQGSKGYNLLDPRKNDNKDVPRLPRTVDVEVTRRFQEIQNAVDPENRGFYHSAVYYALFLFGVAVVIAGLFGWKIWQRKREEWEINDPMALVRELNHVHQLTEQEKHLMKELSAQNALPTPLSLFVEPKFLLEALGNNAFDPLRSTVRRLLLKLFDIIAEAGESSSASGSEYETTIYSRRV